MDPGSYLTQGSFGSPKSIVYVPIGTPIGSTVFAGLTVVTNKQTLSTETMEHQ